MTREERLAELADDLARRAEEYAEMAKPDSRFDYLAARDRGVAFGFKLAAKWIREELR